MNRTLIVALVVGLGLLGAGGYFLMSRQKPVMDQVGKQPGQNNQDNTQSSMQRQSLMGLLQLGNNQQCTFSDVEAGSSGTVKVSGGRARGDFSTATQGAVTGSHMIADSEYVYVWTDGQAQGFKMAVADMEKFQENLPEGSTEQPVDVNQEVDYSCLPWVVDASAFEQPSNVEFKDFSAMMEGVGEMMQQVPTGGTEMQDGTASCDTCNALPASAQAQCKVALGCE